MLKARSSLLVAQCVRDWSGILCEIMGFGIRERGFGNLEIFLSEAETEASKDIAESPTRSGTPKREKTTVNGLRTTVFGCLYKLRVSLRLCEREWVFRVCLWMSLKVKIRGNT